VFRYVLVVVLGKDYRTYQVKELEYHFWLVEVLPPSSILVYPPSFLRLMNIAWAGRMELRQDG
jgi:hypothetical protein